MKKQPFFDTHSYTQLNEALFGMARSRGDVPAITWYDRAGTEHTKTFNELLADSAAFAWALRAAYGRDGLLGINVAIACENSYEWLWAFFGITAAGGTAVLVDVEQTDEAIITMITRADAVLALVSPSIINLVGEKLLARDIRVLRMGEPVPAGDTPYETLGAFSARDASRDEANIAALAALCPEGDSVAVIAYTSGTSSLPKPVMLTHKGITMNACAAVAMVRPTQRVFTALPLYHTYGLTIGALCILFYGAQLGICGDIKRMTRDFLRFNAEILMAVPLMVEMIYHMLCSGMEAKGLAKTRDVAIARFRLLNSIGIVRPMKRLVAAKERGIGKLSQIICGGAHLARTVADNLLAFGVTVLEGYGITECSPLVSVNRLSFRVPHSAGLPLPGYRVRIDGTDREILVSGPMLMKGYYKEPELTAAAMRDGWFATGDVGFIDVLGFLHITGRRKNLIVLKNGKKIAPEEIESYIQGAPLVRDVMAHGAPAGESVDDVRVAITVYPDPEATASMSPYEVLERLQRYVDGVNSRLPAYKQIQMVNISSAELDRTSTRKLKR